LLRLWRFGLLFPLWRGRTADFNPLFSFFRSELKPSLIRLLAEAGFEPKLAFEFVGARNLAFSDRGATGHWIEEIFR